MELKFEITKQHIKRIDNEKPVADSVNYLTAHFDFKTDEWNGNIKSVNFWKNGVAYTLIVDENNNVVVPHEVIKEGIFEVSCFAGDLITNDRAKVIVAKSGYKQGITPQPPTPDVYSDIINKYNRLNQIIKTDGAGEKYLSNDGTYKEVQGGTSTIDHVKVNNVEQPIVDKTVNIPVPTKTSDLTNDSNYITDNSIPIKSISMNNDEIVPDEDRNVNIPVEQSVSPDSTSTNPVSQKAVAENTNTIVSLIPTKNSELENDSNFASEDFVEQEIANFDFIKIVTELPETGLPNRTYFVPRTEQEDNNLYDEYMWVNNAWEFIGTKTIDIDLTNYVKNTDYGTKDKAGIIQLGNCLALKDNRVEVNVATNSQVVNGDTRTSFIVPGNQHLASFYGIEKASKTDGLAYTDEQKTSIQNMFGVYGKNSVYDKGTIDEKISQIIARDNPDVDIIGNVQIVHGEASSFSVNDYLMFPKLVPQISNPFEIDFSFITGTDVVNQQNILDSQFGLAFAIQNGHFVIAMSHNGTSWDIGAVTGTYTVQPSTKYFVKIKWNGNLYSVEYSLDEETYTTDISQTSTLSLYPRQMYIGVGNLFFTADTNYFKGIIDLNDCYLYINGALNWSGMNNGKLGVSLEGLTPEGEQKIKDIAETNLKLNAPTTQGTNGQVLGLQNDVPTWINQQGGSEQWELIAEITTTEEVSSIIINKDSLGNPFSLKKANIQIKAIGTASNTGDNNLRININSEAGTSARIVDRAGGVTTSGRTRFLYANVEMIGNGKLTGYSSVLSTASTGFTDGSANSLYIEENYNFGNDIHLVKAYPNGSNVFGVGSILRLYGVRA